MRIVDACAHPVFATATDLNAYLPKPYSLQTFPPPLASGYLAPIDDYLAHARPSAGLPGSDPALMDLHVLEEPGADHAILVPLTRGFLADARTCSAIDTATNTWLAETWLSEYNAHGRYRGSIRVSPRSPQDAVREIERWADHPYFVQIAVPTEANATYGEQSYFEVWKAASEAELPVVLHGDHCGGVIRPPTVLGVPTSYLEWYSQKSMYGVAHFASFVSHGVFDRLDSLRVVFADGGFDYVQTLLWRLDKDWRCTRTEVPWMAQQPSEYLARHVRFVVHRSEGSKDPDQLARFIELNDLRETLLYGSNYPHWDYLPAAEFAAALPDELRGPIMAENARKLYGLPSTVPQEAV